MPQIIPILLATLLFTCLASFAWGMQCFFVKPNRLPLGIRLTAIAGLVSSLLHFSVILSMQDVPITRFLLAVAAYLSAAMLFWWAVGANHAKPLAACFSETNPEHVTTIGPYRFVRHPFYCSYLLAYLSGVIATESAMLVTTFLLMFAIYRTAAVQEEQSFGRSSLTGEYQAYCTQTGRFFPKLRALFRSSKLNLGFSHARRMYQSDPKSGK